MRSNQLSYPAMMFMNCVEIEGLEPSLTEPESVVLPLHHISIWLPVFNLGLQRYKGFVKNQTFLRKNRHFLYISSMKRILLIFFVVIGTILNAYGQPKSIGARVGGECQISYQHESGHARDFLEVDLGVQALGKGLNVAGAYNFMLAQPQWTEKGEWGVYIGPAVKAAYVWMGGYLTVGAQAGIEYTFDFPLQISLDIRPAVGVAMEGRCAFFFGGEALYGAIPALALRYRF